jgi:serine protease Do
VNSDKTLFVPALVFLVVVTAAAGAQEPGDALRSLQARSAEVFERADPWVVGIRIRVHIPYSVYVSPDGRVTWYARTGPFHLPDASAAARITDSGGIQMVPEVTELPGGTRARSWTDRYGTGFVYDGNGHVVTTYHLVRDATPGTELFVLSTAGRESPATLVAADPYTNIAVLRAPDTEGKPARFADTGERDGEVASPGAFVYCVARPYGLPNSIYFGMVSGLDRRVGQFRYERYIQTTIPLPPGANGAPLVNLDGEVAGMMSCTLKQAGWTEVSFAIPADMVREVVEALIEQGKVMRGFLGVRVVNPDQLPKEEREKFLAGLSQPGAVIREVLPETPAALGGLKTGDTIIAVEEIRIRGWQDLIWALSRFEPGAEVGIRIVRGERTLTQPVRLGKLDPETQRLHRRP